MSFLKHLGTTASKFEFHFWIDHVVGVYPSDYSTFKHSTEGIYCILKRKSKSYRTKIALPENGGYVHLNDCIKFTSTLYQKKKRHQDLSAMLPKPFILRVCDAKLATIRWETTLDLSDYATVFGVDAQESFTLQFSYKSTRAKPQPNALQNIPFEITVRLRVKSTWLNNVDNLSQASTGSTVSRISSSVLSELSGDIETLRLYQEREPNPKMHHMHQHQHSFQPLPEDHSVHNSPIKPMIITINDEHKIDLITSAKSKSVDRSKESNDAQLSQRIISENVHHELEHEHSTKKALTPPNEGHTQSRLGRFDSVLDSFKSQSNESTVSHHGHNRRHTAPVMQPLQRDVDPDPRPIWDRIPSTKRNLSLCSLHESGSHNLSTDRLSEPSSDPAICSPGSNGSDHSNNSNKSGHNDGGTEFRGSRFQRQGSSENGLNSNNINLSMLMSPDGVSKGDSKQHNRFHLKSPPIHMAFARFDTESSGLLMEEELQRIDRRMSSLRDLSLSPDLKKQGTLCSLKSMQSMESMQSIDSTLRDDLKSDTVDNVDYPKLIELVLDHCINGVHGIPMEQRIHRNLIPLHSALIFRCFMEWNVFNENENGTALMLQRYIDYMTVTVQDEDRMHNELEVSYWMIRMTTLIYWVQLKYPQKFLKKKSGRKQVLRQRSRSADRSTDRSRGKDSTEEIEEESEESLKSGDGGNLECWFVQKLTGLAAFCFDNIMGNLIEKLTRIPFDLIFDEAEFGEQGSTTMDMIFASMHTIWLLWDDLRLFDVYRQQICHQILQYTLVQLVNQLLTQPQFCTVAGGFRLKVVRSMVMDWCQSNKILDDPRYRTIIKSLDEVSSLLLTCAVVENGRELLALCPTLSAAQINQILNNYNSEATNEPLSAEILTPIMEIAAWEDPSRTQRLSIQDIGFNMVAMKGLDVDECPLPKISLNDVPVPDAIAAMDEFDFLIDDCNSEIIVL